MATHREVDDRQFGSVSLQVDFRNNGNPLEASKWYPPFIQVIVKKHSISKKTKWTD